MKPSTKSTAFCAVLTLAVLAAAFGIFGCSEVPAPLSSETLLTSGDSYPTALSRAGDAGSPASVATQAPREGQTPEAVLSRMTLEEKASQVLLLAFEGASLTASTRTLLETAPPGGLLLLGNNIGDMNRLRDLTAALQETVTAAGSPGLFLAVDQEGGIVRRVTSGVPALPSARTLGDHSSPSVAKALALMTGAGLLAQGINMVLAPVADVVADPGSFLYERAYGGTPGAVARFVEAVTDGYESSGLVAVVKHFPGHGSTSEDSHYYTPISDQPPYYYLLVHLPPFRAAFAAGAEGVMMGHFVARALDPERPVSLSEVVIRGLLREELGFTGVVVSDDLEMGGATGNRPAHGERAAPAELQAAAVAALKAGCDLLISTGPRNRQYLLRDGIVEAVKQGVLPESRLDEAVLRLLSVKARHGIPLSAFPADSDRAPAMTGSGLTPGLDRAFGRDHDLAQT